jgi:YidC/Oxa1 family membrane protein insertase
MEKRVILFFVLSFIVLYAFRALYMPPPAVSPTQETAAGQKEVSNGTVAETKAKPKENPVESLPVVDLRGVQAEEFTFDTPLYTTTVTNVGGVLKSFRLKQYKDGEGQPVELINQEAGSKVGWPLALVTGNQVVDDDLRTALFAAKREPNKLVLEYATNGIRARKTLEFDPENYEFTVQAGLAKDGREIPHSIVWQGLFGDQSIAQDPAKKHAVYQADTSYKRVALQSLKDEPQQFASTAAGVEDQYFLAIFLRSDEAGPVKVSKHEYPGPEGKAVRALVVSSQNPEDKPVRVYVGPKQRDWLAKADPLLAKVQDYGFWEFIAKPLVFCLLWIHSYIGNFGWSIILLTVIVNVVLFPLRLKQQISMLKMQKIQPQMRRLQDQYKKLKANDPRRTQVQTEMMGLYKEHGVNPMGGCLPLLLQMPLLLGFYSALAYSIELRRAPWMLWIRDLSQPDPYYVIPILMAVAMIVQQKLTPTTNVDPAQARMMMLMPIVMTFMFLLVSSGLALYWFTGSLIGIGQQIFINKYWSPRTEAKLKTRTT